MEGTVSGSKPIVYPETDGKPIAETDMHIDALISLREALKDHFRDTPHVYVAGNLLLYYEAGDPTACVAPDIFVVKGVTKQNRRIYRLWEEGVSPAVVIEITSRSTRLEDLGTKRALYAMLGVQEYFVYDPLGEYLQPPLQSYRLQGGEYERMPPADEGRYVSQELGLQLCLEDGRLRLIDQASGEPLLTPAEAQAARRAAEARVVQEATARRVAEGRAAEIAAELDRVRAELERQRRES